MLLRSKTRTRRYRHHCRSPIRRTARPRLRLAKPKQPTRSQGKGPKPKKPRSSHRSRSERGEEDWISHPVFREERAATPALSSCRNHDLNPPVTASRYSTQNADALL